MKRGAITFSESGLNTDIDSKLISNGDSEYRLNCNVFNDGRNGIITNFKGNELISNLSANYHSNEDLTVLGSCDTGDNRLVIFTKSTSYDRILVYTPSSDSFVSLAPTSMGFNYQYPISACEMDGYVYFTDNLNDPKYINISNPKIYYVCKKPGTEISVTENSGTNVLFRNKTFQWAVRFRYLDNTKSVLSNFTTLYVANKYFYPDGGVPESNIGSYTLVWSVPNDYTIVGSELFVRDNELGDWYLYDYVTHSYNLNYSYTFNGDKVYNVADQTDLTRIFDFVPQKAKFNTIIDKNRLAYANITEGRDNVAVNISASINTTTPNIYNSSISLGSTGLSIVTVSGSPRLVHFVEIWNNVASLPENTTIYVTYTDTSTGSTRTITGITRVMPNDPMGILTAANLAANLNTYFPSVKFYTRHTSVLTDIYYIYNMDPFGSTNTSGITYVTAGIWTNFRFYKTLTPDSTHNVGIVYFDSFMRSGAVNKGTSVTTSMSNANNVYELQVTINNLPPSWASYYAIAVTKRIDFSYFIDCPNIFGTSDDGRLKVFINRALNATRDLYTNLSLSNYLFEQGDMAKLYHSGGVISCNVVRQDNDDASVTFDLASSYKDTAFYRITIYRPYKSDTFYYLQEIRSITGGYHTGDVQNQTSLLPAIVKCYNAGDSYLRARFLIDDNGSNLYRAYDDRYSDFFASNYIGTRRTNIIDVTQKSDTYETGIRFGGKYIENTNINEITKFGYADLTLLNTEFGAIYYIKQKGDVLKILQARKETSIYVGRLQTMNADNSSNLITADSILGTINTFDTERGTTHTKSVVYNNNDIYYFDSTRGEYVRSGSNGQVVISDNLMRNYFKRKGDYFKNISSSGIVAEFDQHNKALLLTLLDKTYLKYGQIENNDTYNTVSDEIYTLQPSYSDTFASWTNNTNELTMLPVGWTYSGGTRINESNVEPSGFSSIYDTSLSIGTGFVGDINTILEYNNSIYIAGAVTSYNGNSTGNIVKISLLGVIDSTFQYTTTGFNNSVYTIKQGDGGIFAGGIFTVYNGNARNRIVKFNYDGSIDNVFDVGTGVNNAVNAICVVADGVVIGGAFGQYKGEDAATIIKIAFNGDLIWASTESNVVSDIVEQSDGKLVYCYSSRVKRLNADGTSDLTYSFVITDPRTLSVQSDDKVIVGGGNNSLGHYVKRLTTSGTEDTTFNLISGSYISYPYNAVVRKVLVQDDDKVIVAGDFTTFRTNFTNNNIIRLNSDGTKDFKFDPDTGFNNSVTAIALQSNGDVLAGGTFTLLNYVSTPGLARFFDIPNNQYAVKIRSYSASYTNVSMSLSKTLTVKINTRYRVKIEVYANINNGLVNVGVSNGGTQTLYNGSTTFEFTIFTLSTSVSIAIAYTKFSPGEYKFKTSNITFEEISGNTNINQTLSYSENGNKWSSFHSFLPEEYISNGIDLYSIKNGLMYKHNSTDVPRNNYYGVQYKQIITWHFNVEASIKKIFRSLKLKTNKAWSVTNISVEPDSKYQRGQQSKLNTNHFENREGEFSANYLNNMLTSSSSPSNIDLINGDTLRGYVLKHTMENSETSEVTLLDAEVSYDQSNLY